MAILIPLFLYWSMLLVVKRNFKQFEYHNRTTKISLYSKFHDFISDLIPENKSKKAEVFLI